ncbi:MarR family winged helix-turn-helix transcriptional regulator [Rhodococcus chondri]|uniref:MarR family transcriptional regulator n=1 Tax=Rhodococcus chondri TaxID=3065941 RepID=A0ABU7JMB6_9NOCA|nr:MarR family transcriptional regulator [Rhodococcus sp. CC-R104]MEE2031173.1 MarR family transcriptional regulator [Rhodococcus sp. CC-R104]
MNSERDDPNWLTADEQNAWRLYMDGTNRLMSVLNRNLQEQHGLSLAEYRILVMLSETADGSLRMSDLADGVLSSRSRLTHQIRRMEDDGMVVRSSCPDDGRGVLATVTDEGRRRLAEAAPTHVDDVRNNLIDLLGKTQVKALARIFGRIDEALSDQ